MQFKWSCFLQVHLLIVCSSSGLWTNAQDIAAAAQGAMLQFSDASYTAKENAGDVRIAVRRIGTTNQSASVRYFTRDGSAISGKDYKETSGILNFAPGETNQTFRVPVYNNNEVDGDRTLSLVLSDPSDGATVDRLAQATLTILDNDRESATWLSFGLNRVELLQNQLLGVPFWKYLSSLVFILLAFLVSKSLDYLARVWLKKWTRKTASAFDDVLLELLNGPIKIVAFVIFLHIGLTEFDWPKVVEDVLKKSLKVVVAVSITYMLLKFIDLLMSYWRRRAIGPEDEQFNKQLFPIIRNSSKAFVVIVAFLVTSQNLGLNITGLIASLSIGGLALGLAAQDTLANLFGAVAVLVDKPFRVGDRIQLEAVDGVVETIGFRSTRVRNLDGHLVTIPNKTVGNATITNIALRPNIRTLMNIGLTYETPAEKVKRALQILDEIFRKNPMTLDVIISFNKFADSSLNIQVVHWWNSTDYKAYVAGMQELNLRIKETFDGEGIEFAFPTQTLYVKEGARSLMADESPRHLPEKK